MNTDLGNAIFEAGGAIFIASNVIKLYRDKEAKGIWIWSVIFFWFWGVWNLYFYPIQHLFISFISGCFVMIFNMIWIGQMIYYARKNNKGSFYIHLDTAFRFRKGDIFRDSVYSKRELLVLKTFYKLNLLQKFWKWLGFKVRIDEVKVRPYGRGIIDQIQDPSTHYKNLNLDIIKNAMNTPEMKKNFEVNNVKDLGNGFFDIRVDGNSLITNETGLKQFNDAVYKNGSGFFPNGLIQKRLEEIKEYEALHKNLKGTKYGLDPDLKYGLNGQEINFTPKCDGKIIEGDMIWNQEKKITLVCTGENKFIIMTSDACKFITADDIFLPYKKL